MADRQGTRVVLLGLSDRRLPPEDAPAGLEIVHLPAAAGWLVRAGGTVPPPVLVLLRVQAETDAGALLAELRGAPGGADVPVMGVMDAPVVAAVGALRAAGTRRILMCDELEMEWATILRAVA